MVKTIWVFWVWLFLILLVIGFSDAANIEGKSSSENTESDLKKRATSENNNNTLIGTKGGLDSVLDDQSKKEGDRVEGAESNLDKSNTSNQVPSKEVPVVKKKKGDSSGLSTVGKGNDKNEKVDNGLEEPKKGTKRGGNGGDSVSSMTLRKDGSRVEECDPTNRCIDVVNKLVACLRVPGNESPHLSLLIQNQGKGPLTVTISAPDFVKIEKTKAELQEKENTEVKVSIEHGGTDTLINLTAGKGRCSLDFKDLIAQNSEIGSQEVSNFSYTNLTRTSTILIVSLAALLLVASSWMCISFRRKRLASNSSKYQRLDMELPVAAVGGKGESEDDDGWDNSWGDGWDDEEAPKTPSLPVTPSLSSKGLAARKLSKDGWKD